MKKICVWLLSLLIVFSMAGCSEVPVDPPALLEPAGVTVSVAQAKIETICTVQTYSGEIVPYVEELYFISDGKLDQFHVQLGDTVEAGQVLATLQTASTQSEIEKLEEETYRTSTLGLYNDRKATANIEIAKVELERLQTEGASDSECRAKEHEIKQMELDLRQTQQLRQMELDYKYSNLQTLRQKLETSQLVAPFSGQIVYLSSISSGGSVKGYTTVIGLADTSKLTLQTDFINESDLADAASVCVKVMDKEYGITYLPYDETEYLTLMLSGEDMKSYFSVDAPAGEIEAGQSAMIVALFDYRENVLTIPLNALYRDREGRHVYKIVDGQRIRCSVTVGAITETKVEILEGLEEGDVIYVNN